MDIDGEFSSGLSGIRMKEGVFRSIDLRECIDGVDAAGFIVGHHDGDYGGVWSDF